MYKQVLQLQSKTSHVTTVVGANVCVRGPLEVKGKGIREVGGVADKKQKLSVVVKSCHVALHK
jgi:hypothetical protein